MRGSSWTRGGRLLWCLAAAAPRSISLGYLSTGGLCSCVMADPHCLVGRPLRPNARSPSTTVAVPILAVPDRRLEAPVCGARCG